ncbi:hypothetical protein VTN77DRAFT_3265 [Rasamsonia byssochlamydoides]|uniref:uncharacterized protein n=1 Tax=Rasamsonia byssochlamydoides TaxID=89139 RepID=UPI003743EBA5
MSFLDPSSGSWASVSGTASILADKGTIQKYYSPALKAWLGDLGDGVHDGGPGDPRIGVIRVEAKSAIYAIARKGIIGRAVEMGKGVATGEAPAINKIRELNEEELAECEFFLFAVVFLSFVLMLICMCENSLTCLHRASNSYGINNLSRTVMTPCMTWYHRSRRLSLFLNIDYCTYTDENSINQFLFPFPRVS